MNTEPVEKAIQEEDDPLSIESLEASIAKAAAKGDHLTVSLDLELLFRTHFDLGQWNEAAECIGRMKSYVGLEDGFEQDEIEYFRLQLAVGTAEDTSQRQKAIINAQAFLRKNSASELCSLQIDICLAQAKDGDFGTAESRLFELLERNEAEALQITDKGESSLWNGNLRFRISVLEALAEVNKLSGNLKKEAVYRELSQQAEAKSEQAVEDALAECSANAESFWRRKYGLFQVISITTALVVGYLLHHYLLPHSGLKTSDGWFGLIFVCFILYGFTLFKLLMWSMPRLEESDYETNCEEVDASVT